EFRPNWASPPGETIRAVLYAKGMDIDVFRLEVGLDERQTADLLAGVLPVTPIIARSLAKSVGSTAHFWLERQKQYRDSLEELAASEPELVEWSATFPVKKMIDSGWLPKPYAKSDVAFELLDYFDIASVGEWRKKYPARLGLAKFRTSEAFQNDIPTTLAWIRRGELLAEDIECAKWDREGFSTGLRELKPLSKIEDPKKFLPVLQRECARHGVAVIVSRSIPGCAASGATLMLSEHKALLLLSARFLSDDQFWFSFFHEAGHLILHGGEPHIEQESALTPEQEAEANQFAEKIILDPGGEAALKAIRVSPFSIARLARQCNVSAGVIVGQLQHQGRISTKLFNRFKTRYTASSFTL
ncbi:MAG: ImmA/IrrE family metallo-endopeptidase, partial [Acidobacteriota bacterium]|nr:ImmA/IrrE family metallo-endopeptidase [Acidobacteriota bacterium]